MLLAYQQIQEYEGSQEWVLEKENMPAASPMYLKGEIGTPGAPLARVERGLGTT
jgi:hypothetical protein